MTDTEPVEQWWDWTDAATWRADDEDEGGNDEPHCDRT